MNTVEKTPDGVAMDAKGAKGDAGKNQLGTVLGGFANALWGVGEVGTFGIEKYSIDSWQDVQDGKRRYKDAFYRHLLKIEMGELIDPDSGLPHSLHMAWNTLAYVEFEKLEEEWSII